MYTLHNQNKKTRCLPGTRICKGCLGLIKLKKKKILNKNKSNIILVLTQTKENKNISIA